MKITDWLWNTTSNSDGSTPPVYGAGTPPIVFIALAVCIVILIGIGFGIGYLIR